MAEDYRNIRVAQKVHRCQSCNETIRKGDSYFREDNHIGHQWIAIKLCLDCMNKAIKQEPTT